MASDSIPEAAVEAAAIAARCALDAPRIPWLDLTEEARGRFLGNARRILEAAAPHMLAGAWEEGFDYARNESWTPEANPYRPTQ